MSRFFLLMLCFALFALTTCSDNLFGSPSNSNCGTDVKCLQMDAENAFRNHDYKKAYDIYSQIVGIDSTASAGYFGMAKAGLWMNGVNPFEVFAHVKKEKGEIAFMNQPPLEQNRYLQGMRKAGPMLRELERRDSLTALYEFHRRNIEHGFDTTFTVIGKDGVVIVPLEKRLMDFRITYCKPAGECSGFPLSDRVFRYNTYNGGLLISSISEKILSTMDTNKDGCITRKKNGCIAGKCNIREYEKDPEQKECECYGPSEPTPTNLQEWANWGCSMKNGKYSYDLSIDLVVNDSGYFEVNLNQILNEIDDDYFRELENNSRADLPDEIESLNEKMDEFNNSMSEIIDIMNGFKANQGTEEIPFNWEENIGLYNDYSTFYKVGTNIDEDGDGCIGEELMDGQDNDGDGLANGNARLVPIDWNDPKKFLLDNIDNSMAGIREWNMPKKYHRDDPNFKHFCRNKELTDCFRPGTEEDDTVTVMEFTQRMPNYWTSQNREDKLRVARDTACPPKIRLEERKELIGGCWPNYTDSTFLKYWLRREFARPKDQEKRVHNTCKKCRTIAECLGK